VRFAALHVPSLVVALDVLAVDRAGQHQPVGTVLTEVQHDGRIRFVLLDLQTVVVDLEQVDGHIACRVLGDEARVVADPIRDRDVGPRCRRGGHGHP